MCFLYGLTAMSPRLVAAADIETLLMPGKVIQGHARFESECSKCHLRFRKGTQSRLCLDCHEAIAADVESGQGFHGGLPDIATRACKDCHSEHLGRDADIVQLDPIDFDHARTDFGLEGAHRQAPCAACHEKGKPWAKAPTACNDCHGNRDPHRGNLGKTCDNCHTAERWDRFRFDHEDTDFPLHGTHRKVRCSGCHANERYEGTPDRCVACHAINDVHAGANGAKCESCHNEKRWDQSDFDHDRETDFPLRGKHRKARCESCHHAPVQEHKPGGDCLSCHRNDDAHNGDYGRRCESCHSEQGWSQTCFDHAKQTDFALTGRHRKLACGACHQGRLDQENLSTDCVSCHLDDDAHGEQEGRDCARCHRTDDWRARVVFDHDLTRFPLLGLHATVTCEECHSTATFRDAPLRCVQCHREDDDHRGTLGPACDRCHNPNAWTAWQFDHDRQTDFRLDGAHADLRCADCHASPVTDRPDTPSDCQSCHRNDDIHQGRFGRDCARCHTTERFSDVHIN